jgi:fructokinase
MGLIRKEAFVGAIEGGGTKYVCAVGSGPGPKMLSRQEFRMSDLPTPEQMLSAVVAWLLEQQKLHGRLEALGFASFGPIDLDPNSSTYGFITATPKPGWQQADVLGPLRRAFGTIPIGFDTDVNGAALGEYFWGAAQGLDNVLYITIGTGIGGGALVRGEPLHGLIHPEMGHLYLPRIDGDTFEGSCPYHQRCWEGLCSGPAMLARTKQPAEDLPADHPAWEYHWRYTSLALANLTFALSPQRIIVGGSLRKAGNLGEDAYFRNLRRETQVVLNGYIVSPAILSRGIETYIVPPLLGDDAGICGAIALAQC